MKKCNILALTGVTLLAAGVLVACSGSNSGSSSASKAFNYVYMTEPETLDYTISGKTSTHEITSNVIDGLLENDRYGNLIPSMAEDWSVSKDGLTYTYNLRKDAKWYTSEGEEYADVKAQDFVTGLKHAVDKKSEALYMVENSIKGLASYIKGETKDFSTVGIKAVDDHTLQFTLEHPESFWNSKLTMGVLFPINEEFLNSKGDKFGQATDPTSILYNGPFLLKGLTSKSSIEFAKNPNYWDKDNVHVDTVKLTYWDGQDQETLIRGFKDGSFSKARVYPRSSNYASVEKEYKDNIVFSPQGSSSFVVLTNIDRQSYNHTSKTTDAQKTSTKKAILNKDFRQALNFAFDRKAYSDQVNGEEGALKSVRNLYVPPTFVQVGDKTFGEVVKEDVVKYGDEWKDVNFDDAQSGLYNPGKAKAEFAKAKETLQAEGVEFPIHLDIPTIETNSLGVKRVQSMKQSIEQSLGVENVIVDIQMMSQEDVNNVTYYAPNAAALDWDITDQLGWTPDYQDPSSYLEILHPKTGDNTKSFLGFEAGTDNVAAKAIGMDEYAKLLDEAAAEKTDVTKRYEKYAAAQAWLTDSSILIPSTSIGGGAGVSKVVPFTAAFAWTGNKGDGAVLYKYIELQDKPVTKKEYDAAQEKWQKEKEESNKKAQEELAKHVK